MRTSGYLFVMKRRLSALYSTTSLKDLYLSCINRIAEVVAEREWRTEPVGMILSR